jgi:hypothetical protein
LEFHKPEAEMPKPASTRIEVLQGKIAAAQAHAANPNQYPHASQHLAKFQTKLADLVKIAGPAGENAPTEADRIAGERNPSYPFYNGSTGQIDPRGVIGPDAPRPGERYAPKPQQGDTITSGWQQQRVPDPESLIQPKADFTVPAAYTPSGATGAAGLNSPTPQLAATQLAGLNNGKTGYTPGEILNILRGDANDQNRDQVYRQNQAIAQFQAANDNAATLSNQNLADTNGMGSQARLRIAENLQRQKGSLNSDLINRGLGMSTVGLSLGAGLDRDAGDLNLGVDESVNRQRIGIRDNLNSSQQGNAGRIASVLTGQQYSDPAQNVAGGFAVAKQNHSFLSQAGNLLAGSIFGGAGKGIGGGIGAGIASLFGG